MSICAGHGVVEFRDLIIGSCSTLQRRNPTRRSSNKLVAAAPAAGAKNREADQTPHGVPGVKN
jgi:hypothetical protein